MRWSICPSSSWLCLALATQTPHPLSTGASAQPISPRGVLLQGSCCPVTRGQDLPQVLTTWSSSSTVLPMGAASSPSPSSGHCGSSPAGGMRSIQPGQAQPGEVGVCLAAPRDSGACTTSTDTTERPRGESRVNPSRSRFAPCQRPAGSVHPV